MPGAVEAYHAERRPGGERAFLYGLIARYLVAMAADASLAPRTKADRRKLLDKARDALGDMELKALESRRARPFLIAWRDTFSATPKTADELLGAVSTVLQWATDRGELAHNALKGFPRIYKVNRADVIWEPKHLAILLAEVDLVFRHAVCLAALTGLRESDLIAVPWHAIGNNAIVWRTGKSRGRRTIVIPLTKPLKALLAEIPRTATTILASNRGRPWKAAGLAAALRRGRVAAQKKAATTLVKAHDPGTPTLSGIEGLRFHDLRGTAATNFLLAGLELTDVALILGWKPDKVREIAARYISGEAMGLAMVKRIGRNAPQAKSQRSSRGGALSARRAS